MILNNWPIGPNYTIFWAVFAVSSNRHFICGHFENKIKSMLQSFCFRVLLVKRWKLLRDLGLANIGRNCDKSGDF